MEGLNLISTFAEFKELKNIDRPTMMKVLEDIFKAQLEKMYGSSENFDIIIESLNKVKRLKKHRE